jgi:asparagine synthase (glutamine-hydrolysing)
MCGIVGVIGLGDKSLIKDMANSIAHRGPDQDGFYVDKNVSLGHRRLSIIDLSENGRQPMSNEDGSIWIVFNGEIYNYKDLRPELEKKGHEFTSETDTEVIIHAYEEYGYSCLEKFNGMFAFAIWDSNKKILFAARDRAGKKPFYFSTPDMNEEGLFIFASELKAIHKTGLISKKINPEATFQYFNHGYIPAPHTIFKNCRKLKHSYYLIYDLNSKNTRVKKYWSLDETTPKKMNLNSALDRFEDLLEKSVDYRLISDVPLGCFLSGGIDSSIITSKFAKIQRDRGNELKTFSIGFDESSFDESTYARTVAETFGTDHHEMIVKDNLMKTIPDLVWQYDEPFGDSSSLPTHFVSKMARKHVTVVLSGDGGDELFGGYVSYTKNKPELLEEKYGLLPKFIRRPANKMLNKISPDSNIYLRTIRELSDMNNLSEEEKFIYKQQIFKDYQKNNLFSEKLLEPWSEKNLVGIDYRNKIMGKLDKSHDPLFKKSFADINSYLPEDILMKVDKASMLNSLETRAPLLDYHIMEFSREVPSELKIKSNEKKFLLKKYLEPLVPKNVIYRPKSGFSIPINDWFAIKST